MEIGLSLSLTSVGGGATTETARSVTVNNASGPALTNYQVAVPLTWLSGMKSDFSDVRFSSDSGGTTILSHWIQAYSSGVSATAWVKVPSIGAAGTATIYLRYGNRAQVPTSNGVATFDFFDDFSGATLDASRWVSTTTVALDYAGLGKTDATRILFNLTATAGQGLIADGTSFYTGHDNGNGVDGSVTKRSYAGTVDGAFTGVAPPHASSGKEYPENGTQIWTSGGSNPLQAYEIDKTTGAKIRGWNISAGYNAGMLLAQKSGADWWLFDSNPGNNSFHIRTVTLNSDGSYVLGATVWSAASLGVPQDLLTVGGKLYYVVSNYLGDANNGALIELQLETNGTITPLKVYSPMFGGEQEGTSFDGSTWYYTTATGEINKLEFEDTQAARFYQYATGSGRVAYLRGLTTVTGSGVIGVRAKMANTFPLLGLSDTAGTPPAAGDNAMLLGRFHSADAYLYGRQLKSSVQTEQAYTTSTGIGVNHNYEVKWSGTAVQYLRDGVSLGSSSTNVPLAAASLSPIIGTTNATQTAQAMMAAYYVYVRKYAATEPVVTVN